MNILKAFLITALLIGLDLLIALGIFEFLDPTVYDSLSDSSLIHYYGITHRIPYVIAYFIVLYLSYRAVFNFNKGIEKVKEINPKFLLYLFLITIGLEFFDRPFFDFSRIYDDFNGIELEPLDFPEISKWSIIYSGISVLIFAPLFEELLFRKVLFGEILKKQSLTVSILISSMCFSLIHLPSYKNLLPTFIFGIITCLIYNSTKNIFYTIILHFLTNLSWLVLAAYGKSYYEWSYGLNYNFIYWLLFIFGAILSSIGIKKIMVADKGYK
ncbi:MAG: CPBP family intramembrane metalloprotease [Saprospiraceae bacterium]|nr:CPBP family intramembrane metalloprotease [Saprospiraceae bacterium]